ncbi:AfsR/SARP family transcriptional regulator [Nocardioides donggukensis]|uniref:SARP family transcriptional regulator n=1 Tax=Nocardioides donggukensis TaxID=2774019 RepID=A0A927K6Q3_9ACTN|nr:BTAD domain-containing putative transcriptional regulator [Nocardioides donggukensis]MBD8868841.1 SARP family transcriptional regulator [Nocardioides donggukensis]
MKLLGWWRLTLGGSAVELAGREQRLTALVALQGTRPRAHLAGTLWPETTEQRALSSLRASVLRVNRLAPGLIEAGRRTVGLGPGVRVDVHDVTECIECIDRLPVPDPHAVSVILAGEELLPGWYDDWVLYERERLHLLRIRALEKIARAALDHGDLGVALDASHQALVAEPLLESALSVSIRSHLLGGNRSEAVRAFHQYRMRLARELRIAPSPELVDLIRPVYGSRPPRPRAPGALPRGVR